MKKTWLLVIVIFVVGLIVIQFFQPEKNITKAATPDNIFFHLEVDELVKKDLVEACYDCHSNTTRYPFYSRVAPISWMMNKHIVEGKKQLNFSDWGKYDKREQLKLISEICEVVSSGEMPLKSYTFMHSSAVLNDKEVENICAWTEAVAEEIFSK